jgi:copper(I)-binding protein
MKFRTLAFSAALMISALAHVHVYAHEYTLGSLHIGHPYARPTVPNQPAGGAYASLENTGTSGDKLLSASSPIASTVQIHTMSMDGNVMRMHEVESIDLPPGAKIAMKPGGGYHFMLFGLKQPLKDGDKFPMTLVFEKAGKIDVSVFVQNPKDGGMDMHEHH